MVIDYRNRVVGIITRKDLLPFCVIEKLICIHERDRMMENSDTYEAGYNETASDVRILPVVTGTVPGVAVNGSVTEESDTDYMSVPNTENETPRRRAPNGEYGTPHPRAPNGDYGTPHQRAPNGDYGTHQQRELPIMKTLDETNL